MAGHNTYLVFDCVTKLTFNNRLDRTDEDAVAFDRFLSRLRDGANTVDDWMLCRLKCSHYSMGYREWEDRGFGGTDVTHLYTTNAEVHKRNAAIMMSLNNPIALVEAEYEGLGRTCRANDARGLESNAFLCVDAKVMLILNLAQRLGLCNGAVGYVKDLVYADGVSAPNLPLYVWVNCGESYTGPTFSLVMTHVLVGFPFTHTPTLGGHQSAMPRDLRTTAGPCFPSSAPGRGPSGRLKVKPYLVRWLLIYLTESMSMA